MPAIILMVLTWFTRYLILKFLVLLGIGVASYTIVQYFFDKYVNAGLSQLGSMGNDFSYFIGLSHLDHAISIVLGAMSVRAFMMAAKAMIAKL